MTMPEMPDEGETKAVAVVKPQQTQPPTTEFDIAALLHTVGNFQPTKEQTDILFAPVDPDEILIRPDGIVYLDWTWYAKRLSSAFPLQWSLVPNGMPQVKDNMLVWGFWLVVKGHLMGFAIGEQSRTSGSMSWGECCEGAKSNALTRLCKGIGMGNSLWHKPFIEDWKSKHAEEYRDPNKNKPFWRRKKPASVEQTVIEATFSETVTEGVGVVVSVGKEKRIGKNWKGKDVDLDEKLGQLAGSPTFVKLFVEKFNHAEHYRNHLKRHFNVEGGGDLTWEQAIALHDHLYNNTDDPKWYPQEKIISGWEAMKSAKELYVANGQESLYNELNTHIETRLGSLDGQKLLGFMKGALEAIGKVFDNPPSAEDVAELKQTLDKDFKGDAT